MKIDVNSIRVGNVLEYNGKLWSVLKTMHTQPGKGGAYMQVEMKDVQTGTKTNVRFRTSENVEKAHLDTTDWQCINVTDGAISLMNMENYEQIDISPELFGELIPFVKIEMEIKVEFHNDKPISASLPDKVEAIIAECEPVVKGQTATSSYKPAILDNGVRITVPPFINQGDKIIVSTVTLEYVERA